MRLNTSISPLDGETFTAVPSECQLPTAHVGLRIHPHLQLSEEGCPVCLWAAHSRPGGPQAPGWLPCYRCADMWPTAYMGSWQVVWLRLCHKFFNIESYLPGPRLQKSVWRWEPNSVSSKTQLWPQKDFLKCTRKQWLSLVIAENRRLTLNTWQHLILCLS